MVTAPVRDNLLAPDEVFVRVGEGVETLREAESLRFDRQTVVDDGEGPPQIVFVGDEAFRNRLEDPRNAIGIELLGTDRWTIGFVDRTTDRYVAILDEDVVQSFIEMVDTVDTIRIGLSFPDSPEAEECPDCQGTNHLNHVYDVDTTAGEEFIAEVTDLVGTQITGRR